MGYNYRDIVSHCRDDSDRNIRHWTEQCGEAFNTFIWTNHGRGWSLAASSPAFVSGWRLHRPDGYEQSAPSSANLVRHCDLSTPSQDSYYISMRCSIQELQLHNGKHCAEGDISVLTGSFHSACSGHWRCDGVRETERDV